MSNVQVTIPYSGTTPKCPNWQLMGNVGYIDILEVPISGKNHHYLLVIMDYFTKWVDAV